MAGSLLDRLAQVLLDDGKLADDLLDALARHALERFPHHVLAELTEALQQRPCRRRQEQPLGPAVIGIGAAFDQAVLAQPVEQAGQSDRLEVEHFGKFGLLEALKAVEPRRAPPIAPG